MVKHCNNDGGTVEQRWWNSGTIMLQQRNDGGTAQQRWQNSETFMLKQKNSDSGTMMVEQQSKNKGRVEQ